VAAAAGPAPVPDPQPVPPRAVPDEPPADAGPPNEPPNELPATRRPDEREAEPGPDRPAAPAPPADSPAAATGPPPVADRPCPRCGAANPHTRRLCGRCGAQLAAPEVLAAAAPPPWWRRVLRRQEHVRQAGYRPRRRAWRRPRVALPVVVLVLAAGGWFARAALADLFAFARDSSAKPVALTVVHPSGSSRAAGHPAGSAFDGYSNRYWAPDTTGSGRGQYLEAEFDRPVRVQKVLITPGCSADEGTFLTQGRPSEVTVRLYTADGRSRSTSLSLDDGAGAQEFALRGSGVVGVRVVVDASRGTGAGRRLAVAEVEFYGHR